MAPSTSSSSSSSLARLNNIANHISPAMSTTNFPESVVPQAPEDGMFGLTRAFKADTDALKVDLVSSPAPPHLQHAIANHAVSHRVLVPTAITMLSPGFSPS